MCFLCVCEGQPFAFVIRSSFVVTRIEVGYRQGVRDARGEAVSTIVDGYMRIPVKRVRTVHVYKIDADFNEDQQEDVVRSLVDPVIQEASSGRLDIGGYDWSITVGFKPGVTDNVGNTAAQTLGDIPGLELGPEAGVYTETRYLFDAPSLTRDDVEKIAYGCLANLLVERVEIRSFSEFEKCEPDLALPLVHGDDKVSVNTVDLGGSDEELERISREGVLSLNLVEMLAIREYFESRADARAALGLGPNPTDAELEVLAQTWSEHCKHKIFSAKIRYCEQGKAEETVDSLFRTYIQGATEDVGKRVGFLVSVFHDNAGAIRFNDRWNLVYKVETHNSPSALDPYGGAITGIVGVNRDPFGTGRGAALLANVWGYCMGSPFHAGPLPKGLLHPRRIRDGVHQGVIDGGNQSGIPYMRGFEWFDRRYLGKPLVYCGTLGIMPRLIGKEPAHEKVVKPGHLIVMVGGRIGKDGIHGATFSSQELHDDSPVQAVQIGDPITQKKMTDFLLEARDRGLYTSITDNGAGGLSSSVGEMAQLSGGCEIDVKKAPLKYQGLEPWEVLLSEAQERMTLAVPTDKVDALMELSAERDVESTVLGTFTDSGFFHVTFGDLCVAYIEMSFLHDGCPVMELEAAWEPPERRQPDLGAGDEDLSSELEALMCRLNICSKEKKSRQYDHEVKGLSVVKPLVGLKNDIPADATVMMVEHGCREGVVMAEGINPRFSDIDTYWMAASVVDLAARRIVAAGGEIGAIAGLDNFCWPDPVQSDSAPDGRHKLAQLVRACRGLYDFTRAFDIPLISGKDSMKNDAYMGKVKISIPPTLLFSAVGIIRDVGCAMTPDAKAAEDVVYVLGKTRDEMGGSEFLAMKCEQEGGCDAAGSVPEVDAEEARSLYETLSRAVGEGAVSSVHTPSLGGLAAGFAFVSMGGELGLDVDLRKAPMDSKVKDARTALFSESNSRFIVTVSPDKASRFEELMEGTACAAVGKVTRDRQLCVAGIDGELVVDVDVLSLKNIWKQPLQEI